MTMLKINIILCIWCNAMFLRNLSFKKHIIFHIPYIVVAPLLRFSETRRFLQSSSFWNAWCALIGQLSSAVWLAEYLKRVTEMLCLLPYLESHSVSTTWWRRQQYYSENKSYTFFLCVYIWAVLCKSSDTVT